MIQVGDTLPPVTLTEFSEVEGEGCSIGPNPVAVAAATAGGVCGSAAQVRRVGAGEAAAAAARACRAGHHCLAVWLVLVPVAAPKVPPL